MSDREFRRYLDGEAGLDSLEGKARAEAEAWERLLDAFRSSEPAESVGAPHWLEDRVMAEIGALPEPGPAARAWSWLLRPRTVSVSPAMAGALAAAAVAVFLLVPGRSTVPDGGGPAVPGAVVYVEFILAAPGARSVAVGGDFDGWSGSHALEDPDGDGVWTGRVPVRPGLHAYMFLLDGSEWVTDPQASRYSDDGFGNRNAVLAVAAPST